jgi:sugar lactone lactonase YvrE
MSALDDFVLCADDFSYVGSGLSGPECVVAEADGTLWMSDNRGGVTRLTPDGRQAVIGSISGKPNGIAMERTGNLLIADIANGKVLRLFPNGCHEVVVEKVAGAPIGAVNFVLVDRQDRIWVTVSTRTVPYTDAVKTPIPDGYIFRFDNGSPCIVTRGICFTNEMRIDDCERFIYVAETALGRVVRLPLLPDGSTGPPEIFGPKRLFEGALIDGITFDEDQNLWVTELTRNALAVIARDGTPRIVFEDPAGTTLLLPTSICFGGADRRTAYVGSLKMDRLATFRAPVPGQSLPHSRN